VLQLLKVITVALSAQNCKVDSLLAQAECMFSPKIPSYSYVACQLFHHPSGDLIPDALPFGRL
jgi:hypothetical protein